MTEAILVIESNEYERKFFHNTLAIHGFNAEIVPSVSDAVEQLKIKPFDLVIISHVVENISFSDSILSVRKVCDSSYVPIMLITDSDSDHNGFDHNYITDVDDYLPRPFSVKMFIARIRAMFRIAHLEKSLSYCHLTVEEKSKNGEKKITKTRSQVKQMLVINKILNIIAADINIDVLFGALAREIRKLIAFDAISIILKNSYQDVQRLVLIDPEDNSRVITKNIYLLASKGPGRVFLTRQIMLVGNVRKDMDSQIEYEQALSTQVKSVVIFPLISKGKLIGILNVGSNKPKSYRKGDIRLVKKVLSPIASSIENASLYSEVKALTEQLQQTVNERNKEIENKYYQLSLLNKVGNAMQGMHELDRLLHLILTCVTAGGAIGFNRAMLLLVNHEKGIVKGMMGVGPATAEEAGRIWDKLSKENWRLDDFLAHIDEYPSQKSAVDEITRSIRLSLDNESDFVIRSIMEKKTFLINDALYEKRVHPVIKEKLHTNEFVIVPLLARDKVLGVIIADKLFSGKSIDKDSIQLLTMFANQAGLAIERADAYEKLTVKIEELKEAYEELKDTQNKLVRSERLATIGKMAAHVAHEIRNPLTTIGGFAHAMMKFSHDMEKVKRNSKIIYEEVYRLERILQNVLDFTKPGSPVFELGCINEVIDEIINFLQDDFENCNITLRKELHLDIPRILFDAQQIRQAFINLIKNSIYSISEAIKCGNGSSGNHLIELSTTTENEYLKIKILDTGVGMTPTVIENLFNPFFTTKPGGSGLGLAVTHKIIEEHGGFIDVISKVGSGSEFIIYLPLRTDLSGTP
ncbi:MAG: GAF domain-containing protein [Candidatus Auribacterota bacterium]|jgi:signal transduction histidine kinase|nr:GAF domain-containing protein [Candidatus Auribacterota bacterium]